MIHTDCTRNPCSAFLYNYSDHSCVKNKRYILNLILGEILTKQTKCPFTAHLNSSALHRGPGTVGCCWRVARAVDCCDPVSGLLLLLFGSAVIRNVSGAKRWAESTEHSRSRGALWSFVGASLSPGWAESVSMLEVLGRRWYHHHLSHNNCQPPILLPESIYYSSMHGIINQNMPILCPYRVKLISQSLARPDSTPCNLVPMLVSPCSFISLWLDIHCPDELDPVVARPGCSDCCLLATPGMAPGWRWSWWAQPESQPEDEQTPARPDQRRYAEPHRRGKTGPASPDRAEILLGCIPGIHLRVARSVFHAVSHTVNLWAYLGGVSLFS